MTFFFDILIRYYGCGMWAGKIFCVIIALGYLLWRFLEWYEPKEEIELLNGK